MIVINKVILMGRLTKDIEMRYLPENNTPVCSFTLAVDRRFSKKGEDRQADFLNCQAWQKTAEFISKYFSKGSMLGVVGRLQNRSWDDKDGKKHYVTEVVVEEAYFTGSKNQSNQTVQSQSVESAQTGFYPEDDDELPF